MKRNLLISAEANNENTEMSAERNTFASRGGTASVYLCIYLLLSLCLITLNGTFIHLAWAADAYGNDVEFVEIYQYDGSAWNLVENFTSSGGSCRVHDGWPTNFTVSIKFNSTLASSTAEAIDYTRLYMNISESIWTNEELNNTACSLVGSFYILTEEGHWNQTGKPVAGTTYECSVSYQGYY